MPRLLKTDECDEQMKNAGKWLRGFVWAVLVMAFVTGCESISGPEDMPTGEDNFTRGEVTLRFRALRSLVMEPGQVQFLFALRDLVGNAIVLPAEVVAQNTRIKENGREIDYRETNFFMSTAANFRMDVVLVLDFTNSMATFREGNVSGIDQMLAGARSIIRELGLAHRMAIIEFHDRNVEPEVLTYFTADTTFLLAQLQSFAARPIDHGATRVWDAVEKGIALFSEVENPEDVRLLIFLSDGFDTSSRIFPSALVREAKRRKVQIHSVGTGQVANRDSLQLLAQATEGVYYPALDLASIKTQLQEIGKNLSGQYKLSYISLLRGADPSVRIEIDYANATNYFEKIVSLKSLSADDRRGRMTYDGEVVADSAATAILRLLHTPRNISRFRFRLQSEPPPLVSMITPAQGGLLDDSWQLSGPDAAGWYDLRSAATVLPFGAFGLLFKATFLGIQGSGIIVPFTLDTTIYSGGKTFSYPDTLQLGLPIEPILPAGGAEGVSRRVSFKWRIVDSLHRSFTYDVQLDTTPQARATIASALSTAQFDFPQQLEANTTYYWKVIAHSESTHFVGPTWRFKTGAN